MKKIYRDQPYTITELCKDTGISSGSIIEYINGKRKWGMGFNRKKVEQ